MTMINANDGGANVSFTGGRSWTGPDEPADGRDLPGHGRQPLPLLGVRRPAGQQHGRRPQPWEGFYDVGGGESGHIAVDPRNPDIVYADPTEETSPASTSRPV